MGDEAPAANSSAWSETVPTRTDAGEYTVWYMVPASTNYTGVEAASVKATIAPATLTVKANPSSKVEGDADPAFTYQVSGLKGTDSRLIVSGTLTREEGEKPGTYKILQGSVKSSSNNYAIEYTGADFTITAKPEPKPEPEPEPEPEKQAPVVTYDAHVQTDGDKAPVTSGFVGTTGESKRLEAIQMKLDEETQKDFSVWYRVHCQTYGWSGWTCDGEHAGTTGLSRRAEAVEVEILPVGAAAPGSTDNALRTE